MMTIGQGGGGGFPPAPTLYEQMRDRIRDEDYMSVAIQRIALVLCERLMDDIVPAAR